MIFTVIDLNQVRWHALCRPTRLPLRLIIASRAHLKQIIIYLMPSLTNYGHSPGVNPTIARTLVEFGWVRELNEGVQRIYDEMASFFLREPTFSEPNGASVRLTLENSATSRVLRRGDSIASDLGDDALGVLGEYELAALQYVYGRGRVTVKELSGHLGRSAKVARTALKSLSGKGILDRHGTSPTDPSQYYDLHRA